MAIKNNTSLFMKKQPGGHFMVIDQAITTGDVWFVDSATGTDSLGRGRSPQDPFATLDYAVDFCTADQGDIIYLMPAHAETETEEDIELFDINVAGITVIGLGVGDKRPTFTFEDDGATVVLGAANCRLSNIRFISGVADLATVLEIEAAATGNKVDHCYFADTSAAEMLVTVAIEANADNLIFEDNHINGAVGGDATGGVVFAGGCDNLLFQRNIMRGDWDTQAALDMSGAASTNVIIAENVISNNDGDVGLAYAGHSGTTGFMIRNYLHGDKDGTVPVTETTALHLSQNYGGDEPATSGILIGTPATWA